MDKIREASNFILKQIEAKPSIGVILGSGLGELAGEIGQPVVIGYRDIPYFPEPTVEGHAGKFVVGTLHSKSVVAMQGRFHYYEGHSMQDVTFPVRVMKWLGVDQLIVTNACGGLNPAFKPGDLMLIQDHINMTGDNPLIGENEEELGPRFPDMSRAYAPDLQTLVQDTAEKLNIPIQKGVYAGISGPSYMTAAELNMLRIIGADTVGMSTVPEVIVANHMSMSVIGLSCITDMAIAEELQPLTHEQVIAVANRTKPTFKKLVKEIIKAL
ncbi:purine-nucleoside phosphorylase [Pueribacillus theae]